MDENKFNEKLRILRNQTDLKTLEKLLDGASQVTDRLLADKSEQVYINQLPAGLLFREEDIQLTRIGDVDKTNYLVIELVKKPQPEHLTKEAYVAMGYHIVTDETLDNILVDLQKEREKNGSTGNSESQPELPTK
jgi:hypothetical protein